MTEKEKERLGEAIDEAIKHTLIDLDGEILTLQEAMRKYRGGNYLATKWRKCWCVDQEMALYKMQIQPTHWMNLPLPPAPDGGIENGT